MSNSRLIVGLGNPGNDYEFTRHNLGFLVIRCLVSKLGFKLALSSFTNGLTAEGQYKDTDVCLLMPLTYMNNSGKAVKRVLAARGFVSEDMLVITDDFNLDFLQMRLRKKGSDGGHNGLSSIITCCETNEFPRLRMGIGEPKNNQSIVDFVLAKFTDAELQELDAYINNAAECVLLWLEHGADKAMEYYNRKR